MSSILSHCGTKKGVSTCCCPYIEFIVSLTYNYRMLINWVMIKRCGYKKKKKKMQTKLMVIFQLFLPSLFSTLVCWMVPFGLMVFNVYSPKVFFLFCFFFLLKEENWFLMFCTLSFLNIFFNMHKITDLQREWNTTLHIVIPHPVACCSSLLPNLPKIIM